MCHLQCASMAFACSNVQGNYQAQGLFRIVDTEIRVGSLCSNNNNNSNIVNVYVNELVVYSWGTSRASRRVPGKTGDSVRQSLNESIGD